jgi:leucyl-tRNA synthetase
MDYNPRQIEQKWKEFWNKNQIYKVTNSTKKPKFYVLDMFPYPSGSGLHVGHPLGYIASDIFARYKRHKGFNVLHPMGYDAFGLPAEQYAIQTGVHPATSTDENIERYREQLDNIGFSFDWSRQVKTSDPSYYKWTQWLFLQLFENYYDNDVNKASSIEDLKNRFATEGNTTVNAATTQEETFSAPEWNAMTAGEQDDILMNYRLAYRKVGYVNWCEELGTVLANDEVKDGVSERGGFAVERRAMLQWSLRITAYAEKMLNSLEALEWTDSLKAQQRNWIGRSEGAIVFFDIDPTPSTREGRSETSESQEKIEVFTTRPDTVFGVTFMVLAPEHDFVSEITTAAQKNEIEEYLTYVNTRSERERMAEVKEVTGAFTGAYAINPFTNTRIPIYISEYVLKDYGTGAIMAVPSDDERDNRFAEKFGIEIIEVIDKSDYPGATMDDKIGKMINSGFLNGLEVKDAIRQAIDAIDKKGIGQGKINYRLRDANYSRQRYWGEPFPIRYKDGVSIPLTLEELPLNLPDLDDYKPSSGGKSPLARLDNWVNLEDGSVRETDTMPGFAGSSWYFLRYMDATNDERFVGEDAINYWQDVDLYVGGTEHAVGHLMYARFWHKVLFEKGLVPTNEPFKKLINQGMIQGRSNFVYRANEALAEQILKRKLKEHGFDFQTEYPVAGRYVDFAMPQHKLAIEVKSSDDLERFIESSKADYAAEGWKILGLSMQYLAKNFKNFDKIIDKINRAIAGDIDNSHIHDDDTVRPVFFSHDFVESHQLDKYVTTLHVDVNIVENDFLDVEAFKKWRPDYENAIFVLNHEGKYLCGHAVEKMSKSKYNIVNPDLMVEKYGADCFRMYEMFLGPIEQSKPWNTNGIEGVSKFLRKFWGLFYNGENFDVSDAEPTKAEYKILHTAIKKVTDDIERFSLNTCVSAFMVLANDLKAANCNKKAILQEFVILIAPFAPHIAEELWQQLGNKETVVDAQFPKLNEAYLKEDSFTYPIAINGKMREKIDLPADMSSKDAEAAALALPKIQKHIEGKTIRKVIVVPKRMINIVVS